MKEDQQWRGELRGSYSVVAWDDRDKAVGVPDSQQQQQQQQQQEEPQQRKAGPETLSVSVRPE